MALAGADGQDHLIPVLGECALECVVWDGEPAHKARVMRDLPAKRVLLPPYSLELDPTERVFGEIRRRIEGPVYEDLAAKREAVERYLP